MSFLEDLLAHAPDPDGTRARFASFSTAASDHGGLERLIPDDDTARLLVAILAQSPVLSRRLIADPARLPSLARDAYLGREKPAARLRDEVAARVQTMGELAKGLRASCADEYLRLGARELGWGTAEEVARELAHLADACLDVAVEHLRRELAARYGEPLCVPDGSDGGAARPARFVVFGMGKHGGEELNFSSDIDLIYVYESDTAAPGSTCTLGLHEWFSKLAERLTRAIDETTSDGNCFRVDLRLRPEGTRGPLVNSVPALERYYESWGRPWERQAWIKARPVAGDGSLGDEVLRMLAPFVWPRSSFAGGAAAVQAVQEMVTLLHRARASSAVPDDDVKLGPGGIREVEFFVQALQLIHGGRQPALRRRGTLAALDRLLFAGLVSERESRELGDAYLFLRRVEHRLQLEEMLQTHCLPPPGEARERLAARLGYATQVELDSALAWQRARVSDIFRSLGAARSDEEASADALALLDPDADRVARTSALARLGFRDLAASVEEVARLVTRPRSPFAPSAPATMQRAAARLVDDAAACPDPDLALRRLNDLVARRGAGAGVWRLVAEHRPLGRLLVSLFGTSDFLTNIFVAHPELVEPMLASASRAAARSREEHLATIADRLARADDDDEARLGALRRYKNEEVLRIGLGDVAGEVAVDRVSTELSTLAEACLEAALGVVTRALCRRYTLAPLAVIGLGKLGGGELGYASDLDLVFVYRDDGGAPSEHDRFEAASRQAQRLIRALDAFLVEGRLYEVDTRLRPSGQKGALVSSLDGFRRYHRHSAALWERQALIKARAVAGDRALGAEVEAICAEHVWGGAVLDAREAAVEIGRLRARMERELADEAPERGRYDIKVGRGGLVDIEFLVQLLQLVHGPSLPPLRVRSTRLALDLLRDAALVPVAEHADLVAGWTFLRRLESRLRLVHDRSIATLATDPASGELDKLARRLGYRGGAAGTRLVDEYREHTSRIRAVYARYLPVDGGGNDRSP